MYWHCSALMVVKPRWIFCQCCTLREKCLYSELFSSVFSRIWTEYGEIRSIASYSVQIRENADQNNSEYRHLLRRVNFGKYLQSLKYCQQIVRTSVVLIQKMSLIPTWMTAPSYLYFLNFGIMYYFSWLALTPRNDFRWFSFFNTTF